MRIISPRAVQAATTMTSLNYPMVKWGFFIGDVSGHGTPAAVMMAVTHCMAHTHPGPASPPGAVLKYLNRQLSTRYTNRIESFVTAFYGVYDPQSRKLVYASAGHNPPRVKRCEAGVVITLDKSGGLPLGVMEDAEFNETSIYLQFGDQIVLYTDGITETQNAAGEQFGELRVDAILSKCGLDSAQLMHNLLTAVDEFANGVPRARRPHADRIACDVVQNPENHRNESGGGSTDRLKAGEGAGTQNSACPGVLGNGITSRMFVMPVISSTARSRPRPKPE